MSVETLNNSEIETRAHNLAIAIKLATIQLKADLFNSFTEINIDKMRVELDILKKTAELLKVEVSYGTSLEKHWFSYKDGNITISVFER